MVIRDPSALWFAVTRLNYSQHGSKLEGLVFIFNYCQTRLHQASGAFPQAKPSIEEKENHATVMKRRLAQVLI